MSNSGDLDTLIYSYYSGNISFSEYSSKSADLHAKIRNERFQRDLAESEQKRAFEQQQLQEKERQQEEINRKQQAEEQKKRNEAHAWALYEEKRKNDSLMFVESIGAWQNNQENEVVEFISEKAAALHAKNKTLDDILQFLADKYGPDIILKGLLAEAEISHLSDKELSVKLNDILFHGGRSSSINV